MLMKWLGEWRGKDFCSSLALSFPKPNLVFSHGITCPTGIDELEP